MGDQPCDVPEDKLCLSNDNAETRFSHRHRVSPCSPHGPAPNQGLCAFRCTSFYKNKLWIIMEKLLSLSNNSLKRHVLFILQ